MNRHRKTFREDVSKQNMAELHTEGELQAVQKGGGTAALPWR